MTVRAPWSARRRWGTGLLAVLAVVVIIVGFWSVVPPNTASIVSHPNPAADYAEAVRRVELAPYRHGIASSRDLGYSLGLLILRKGADTIRPDTVSYLHVWRHEHDGPWKLAVDVENVFGRRK